MVLNKWIKGLADPITLVIIVACFAVGGLYAAFSKKVDEPLEQAAEAVLRTQGIDIDFSVCKKLGLQDCENINARKTDRETDS